MTATWSPDLAALDTDPAYHRDIARWLEVHGLDGFKVLALLVDDDRWVHAVTRTNDGRDVVRVVTALEAPPPMP